MLGFACVRNFLAVIIVCGSTAIASSAPQLGSDAEWQNVKTIRSLVVLLEAWLDTHTDLSRREVSPKIRVIPWTVAAMQTGIAGREHGFTRGLYDQRNSTIYLIEPWAPTDEEDVSVLLHELVHHRQAPLNFYCPGAQEDAAYRLQDEWLREQGMQADVNWIEVVLAAGCTPKDIHPE